MHGKGLFVSLDGTAYDGVWSSVVLTGFGSMLRGRQQVLNIGWLYEEPFGGVVSTAQSSSLADIGKVLLSVNKHVRLSVFIFPFRHLENGC